MDEKRFNKLEKEVYENKLKLGIHENKLKNVKNNLGEIKENLKENNRTTKANLIGIIIQIAIVLLVFFLNNSTCTFFQKK